MTFAIRLVLFNCQQFSFVWFIKVESPPLSLKHVFLTVLHLKIPSPGSGFTRMTTSTPCKRLSRQRRWVEPAEVSDDRQRKLNDGAFLDEQSAWRLEGLQCHCTSFGFVLSQYLQRNFATTFFLNLTSRLPTTTPPRLSWRTQTPGASTGMRAYRYEFESFEVDLRVIS